MHLLKSIFTLSFLVLTLLLPVAARAQEQDALSAKTVRGLSELDSLAIASRSGHLETTEIRDTVAVDPVSDSLALLAKSSLQLPAFSKARDSIVEVFADGQRKIFYYGDVSVSYEDMTLSAEYMEYDMATGMVFARGVYDTLSGEWIGQPVMTQAGETYNMEEVHYNFNTRKARITNMLTSQDNALLHGKKLKMQPDNSVSLTGGKYSVCELEHPHYYLALSTAKVETKPKRKTVFGPACLVVEDVPLYPIGLPFGFIPKSPQRATGLLMPTIGEEEARGFYMRDLGMYFVLGDHFDFSVTGDYYTLGSWAIDVNSRYKVRYKFTGNVGLTYSKDKTEDFETTNFQFKWSHSQDSKAHPGSSFTASVNFSSPSNNRYNSHSVTEALNNQVQSSVSYSHNWNGKFNLSVNALGSQNSRDSSYSFSLPNITFSLSTIYPFKRKNRVGKEKFYERFSFGYNTTLQNKIDFKASEFGQEGFLDRFKNGMTHSFNIGIPNFTLFKYININPGVNYGMNWFFRKTEYQYDPEQDKPVPVQGSAFGTFGVTQTFSASLSANTRLYGMYNFGKQHNVQAIRHVISPSVGFSWSPDMAQPWNGYRTLNYIDVHGVEQSYEYNIYEKQLYGVPGKGQNASANFSINNNLEAKVRDLADTTGVGSKKVKLIDNFTINGGYNFLADSMRLNNIAMSLSTRLFDKVGVNASMNFDPYAVDRNGKRHSAFALSQHQGLLRLNTFSTSLSYAISGKGEMKGNTGDTGGSKVESAIDYYQRMYYHPYTNEYIPGGWLYYTNPNVPWSVNLSYNLSWTRTYRTDTEGNLIKGRNLTQTMNISGNVKITPKLSLNLTSGFDFTALKVTTTQISATYDLHCFNISVQWIPLGTYKSYSFCISANASTLADLLKFKKSSSYWDN